MRRMNNKLQELNALINKLQERINKITDGSTLSSIEKDILLDLLRSAYVTAEELDTYKYPTGSLIEDIAEPSPIKEFYEVDKDATEKETREEEIQEHTFQPQMNEPQVIAPYSTQPIEPEKDELPDVPIETVVSPAEDYSTPSGNFYTPTEEDTPRSVNMPADLFSTPTIADKLKTTSLSLNDTITGNKEDQSVAHKMQLKPISDLKTAIGINEKFQFVNDLFDGRIEKYNEAISRLNSCSSLYEANGVLSRLNYEHNWKEGSEACNKLSNFITRRYL